MTEFDSDADLFMLAIAMWRECRGGGKDGMTAVGCSIRNRVVRDGRTYFEEIIRPLQFSSITMARDPELTLYPKLDDPTWEIAQELAEGITANTIEDTTGGATLYYAASIPFPVHWDQAKCVPTVTIGGQHFFRELA